jgi:hypothetical protein
MGLCITPVTLREANAFITRYHRHHKARKGLDYFAAACSLEEEKRIVGVVIVGRPHALALCNGFTAEATRVCTDGTRNAPSMLYRGAWRACRALGYLKLITYTLPEEGGASLRGAGFVCVGEAVGGSWDRPNIGRPRVDLHPTQTKLRWEAAC